ncbi:hypothetical protein BZA70DRAFT_294229 [Myxozyma melibiosi]|uniref:Uncharacterized protein n=1 Tax=Myxozyma melibiosi TaxID=54550 RepID=A0ABR1FAS8_9ASCO
MTGSTTPTTCASESLKDNLPLASLTSSSSSSTLQTSADDNATNCSLKSYSDGSVATICARPSPKRSISLSNPYALVQSIAHMLGRMESEPLTQQRYTPTTEKLEAITSLALETKINGVLDLDKLEKALGRRMSQQDFILRRATFGSR